MLPPNGPRPTLLSLEVQQVAKLAPSMAQAILVACKANSSPQTTRPENACCWHQCVPNTILEGFPER